MEKIPLLEHCEQESSVKSMTSNAAHSTVPGVLCAVLSHSVVSDSVTSCTIACQAPLSMGILQARILEWVTMPSSKGSSQPRDQAQFPTLQADSLPSDPPGKPKNTGVGGLFLLQGIFPTQELNHQTGVSCIAGGFFAS